MLATGGDIVYSIGVVDLFCGVGGLTYGIQKAGLKVVAGIDLDTSCEYAFSHNNKSIFIGRGIESVSGKDIKSMLKGYKVKVLVGCAPCQPFSNHQKDKKIEATIRIGSCYMNLPALFKRQSLILFPWKMFRH